jgi:hypothetical protein
MPGQPPAEHDDTVPTTPQHPGPWNPATTPTTRGHPSHPECRIRDHGGQEPADRLAGPSHARSGLVEGLVVFTILMAFVIYAVRKPTPMSEALTATRRPVAIMP